MTVEELHALRIMVGYAESAAEEKAYAKYSAEDEIEFDKIYPFMEFRKTLCKLLRKVYKAKYDTLVSEFCRMGLEINESPEAIRERLLFHDNLTGDERWEDKVILKHLLGALEQTLKEAQ